MVKQIISIITVSSLFTACGGTQVDSSKYQVETPPRYTKPVYPEYKPTKYVYIKPKPKPVYNTYNTYNKHIHNKPVITKPVNPIVIIKPIERAYIEPVRIVRRYIKPTYSNHRYNRRYRNNQYRRNWNNPNYNYRRNRNKHNYNHRNKHHNQHHTYEIINNTVGLITGIIHASKH